VAIKLAILETEAKEEYLFLRLVKRGRHAETPYYFSVDSYSLDEGWVLFERLDCAPVPSFRVGVAGNLLIVSKKDVAEVSRWLDVWEIKFTPHVVREKVETPEAARALLREMRESAPCAKDRAKINEQVKKEIADFDQQVEEQSRET
jgi:hypothetical protein